VRDPGKKTQKARLRLLTEEEVSLWVAVARTVTPQPGARLPKIAEMDVATAAEISVKARSTVAATAKPSPTGKSAPLPLAPLERRMRQRIARGRLEIDATVDLHGLRQDQAHATLLRFLSRARQNHARVVLVVTGKGRSASATEDNWAERGILRRMVPIWLAAPDLRHIILGFEEATLTHGGSGALYVRLRGQRGMSVGREEA
jgi:DNA-nicking Smr family endonuclease